MQQLIRLRRKVQKNETLGVGNLQLSYALSLMMSGLFFQINEPRDAGDDALWAIVREHDRSRVRDVLVSALATETGVDRGDDIRPLYEILMMDYARVHRQDADNRLGDLHLLHRTLTAPGVAFRGHLGDQLYEFNAAWFTWDVVNAARLLAMCKLSLLVERAARANDTLRVHERFEKAVAVLDPLERQSLWATVPPGLGPTERNLAVWTDIRIQSAAKGRPILGLVRGRLDAQRGNEVLR